ASAARLPKREEGGVSVPVVVCGVRGEMRSWTINMSLTRARTTAVKLIPIHTAQVVCTRKYPGASSLCEGGYRIVSVHVVYSAQARCWIQLLHLFDCLLPG
ncbi:unnamed protein product, partial [Ectocarpus sp. 13 AM-2016]